MKLEEYQQVWSDFHKEAYGYRPHRPIPDWTLEEWAKEFDTLGRICQQNREDEDRQHAEAAQEVEALISRIIDMGAGSRPVALRWLHEAHNTDGDDNYLCYCLHLSYNYFVTHS